jgi:hypothetical protein
VVVAFDSVVVLSAELLELPPQPDPARIRIDPINSLNLSRYMSIGPGGEPNTLARGRFPQPGLAFTLIEKTAGSRREVVLVPQLAKVLREHRMASRYKAPTDFVFPAPDGRGLLHSVAARGVERAVAKAGLEDVTPHTFRHGFASMLIVGLKLDPVNVARQLGHSDPSITLSTYSHLFERARHADEMRQALGDGFGHLLSARSS